MKAVVYNLGCKVNQCECDSLTASLRLMGYDVTDEMVFADKYIINTCAVTKEAERKSRQYIGKAQKLNPDAEIYVIGCAAQKNSEQFALKGVKYISGTAKKELVLSFLEGTHVCPLPTEYETMQRGEHLRARAYVKIEDGCNNFCSYCIIPYLRGRCRSESVERVVDECRAAALTTDEIVLTGINVSAYGKDTGTSLPALVRALSGVNARFRFGSLEVGVIDDELLTAMREAGNFCPHFHLSLQSGSTAVLKSMNRHYTADEYYQKITLLRSYFPTAAITTDVIVGYPTEGDAEFEETVEFVKKVAFSNVHIFPYSRRQGTAGYHLGELPQDVLKARADKLRKVKDMLKREYESSFVGCEMQVLVETNDGVYSEGYSQNYVRVYIKDTEMQAGKIYHVVAISEHADGLLAE